MIARAYASPLRFKEALEQRLRNATQGGAAFARKRQLLVFDRFLARTVAALGDAIVLKGGLVLELRLDRARSTNDIDLRMMGTSDDLLLRLQAAGRLDLGDFMRFEVGPNPDGAEIDNDGLRYEGLRFRALCKLAGKPYGQPFGVDVVFGEPMLGEPEERVAEDVLGFAGILPPRLRLYPIETHIAEKLHALTMPRLRPNSRVKDLPDIALLAGAQSMEARRLRQAFEQTFAFRGTHPLPMTFPEAPPGWATPYAAMARADALPWPDLVAVTLAARRFLDPVLAERFDARWEPAEAVWRRC
ncbi:MAG TPA: nucleotidyl transferase AbiEii/AbiGii toxin family protein [Myxococcota bacterium]|nr:nucleotidyl transferase AbiEii/AbiGii toxin family protein [Myxococcota bacterium]HND28554.1 nucleotidyl transferase AbiEii/AbiGii toxin family protein [Myxococcota bacterium]